MKLVAIGNAYDNVNARCVIYMKPTIKWAATPSNISFLKMVDHPVKKTQVVSSQ